MAYPAFYPQYYPQYPQLQAQPQPQQQTQPQMQQQMQTQTTFISVPNEDVARNYPVAHGNSITFKDENAPYIYTKTMGFSQLDRPIFERYKLIREEDTPIIQQTENKACNCQSEIDSLNEEVKKLWDEINELKGGLEA